MSKEKAKKAEPKAVKASKIVEGLDARVLVNIYSPGHEPQEFRVTVPNIVGASNLLHRSPEMVKDVIVEGLRKKYGERVS